MKIIRIGTRGSKLAMWQAHHVAGRITALGAGSEIVVIRTVGDHVQQAPVGQIGLKGVFIKELEEALLSGEVDLAVHSMKDVPTEIAAGLAIVAIPPRADPRDALVSRGGETLEALPTAARIGTSSLRRQAQLLKARPDLAVLAMRGNVDKRLAKLDRGEFDAIVLACAGLQRLGASQRVTQVLSPEICLPAVGQGALGIEAREADQEVVRLLEPLDDRATRAAIRCERTVMAAMQGGCQLPLGAWARLDDGHLVLDAVVLSADGSECLRRSGRGRHDDPEGLGRRVAQELFAAGAERILQLTGRSRAAL